MNQYSHGKTRQLVGTAIFTVLIVILQLMGAFIRFGPFSISLVAMPIVIGSAVYGIWTGAWLGLVFGAAVLLSGDAAAFFVFSPVGTILTVIVKGICCGLAAGAVYSLLEKKSPDAAAVISAVVCPVVNTGVFLLGCLVFFVPLLREWSAAMGFGENVGSYMILGLVGGNFLAELILDIVLCPVILRLIRFGKKGKK